MLPVVLAVATMLVWAVPCLGAARVAGHRAAPDPTAETAATDVGAPTAATTATSLTLDLSPAVVDYDGSATLSGRLSAADLPVPDAGI
ncbi:MAG TPA: hypothetical protein VK576_05990, partial [Thermoleophilia bacterium]|nr:hypothetical protein [Thermoleophilia bacterium]